MNQDQDISKHLLFYFFIGIAIGLIFGSVYTTWEYNRAVENNVQVFERECGCKKIGEEYLNVSIDGVRIE